MKTFPTLYKQATTGKIQQWVIISDGPEYYSISGEQGGKQTTTKPSIAEGKNIGKANETSPSNQAEKEAQAKWDHKLAHGYAESPGAAEQTLYSEPMLAKKYVDYIESITLPAYIDNKLNGMRINARADSVKSRKGKPCHSIPHIVAALAPLFAAHPAMFLDGESFNDLYKNSLNRLIELTSVAYKPKDLTPELLAESKKIVQFHVYDGFGFNGITQQTPFVQRRAALKKLLSGVEYVYVLDYTVCQTHKDIRAELAKTKQAKSEGIIIRWGGCPYEFKRSKYLLKLKNWVTEEFEVVGLEEGDADWAFHAKRAILKLPAPVVGRDGKVQTTFSAGIEGNMPRQKKMFEDRASLIGRLATVTYGELSPYGIPLTPVLEVIRDYE